MYIPNIDRNCVVIITRMISTKEEGRGGTFVTDNRYICRNASVLVNHRTPPLDTPGTSSGEEIRLRNYRGARGKLGLWRRKLWLGAAMLRVKLGADEAGNPSREGRNPLAKACGRMSTDLHPTPSARSSSAFLF